MTSATSAVVPLMIKKQVKERREQMLRLTTALSRRIRRGQRRAVGDK